MEQKGIKELSELLVAIEVVAVAVKKVMKDGKVDLSDASIVIELGSNFQMLAEATMGLGELPEEVMDIDAQEAVALVAILYSMAKKVQAA